ncbi:hypothetical protein DFH08DRAFT_807642 [Mycena albidolilacea]|uniref:Uncharacterized protein n=1 Tax=Mycena albidolilacea TaxID=1033008 RepID=A0AAD7ETL1_9AGAR|nr:hypothetical protein DFH08DRAFT_807642 [Mycena albidolilacea]
MLVKAKAEISNASRHNRVVESPLSQAATPGSDTPPLSSSRDRARRSSPSRSFLLLETNGVNSSRTPCTADAAIASLKASVSPAQIEFLAFDLTSLRATKTTAEEFLEREALGYTGLEGGGIWQSFGIWVDGRWGELQACNGTGHFALALLLLWHIASLPDAHGRVVTLSSEGQRATQSRLF